jgi:hypothetical protein
MHTESFSKSNSSADKSKEELELMKKKVNDLNQQIKFEQ